MSHFIASTVHRARRSAFVVATALVLALAGTGCGGYYDIAATGTCDGGQRFASQFSGPTSVTLVNDTGQTACYIRFTPTGSATQSDDWLGSTETVAPGAARMFNMVAGRVWNIRIENCEHGAIALRESVPIFASGSMDMSSPHALFGPTSAGGEATVSGPAAVLHVNVNVAPDSTGATTASVFGASVHGSTACDDAASRSADAAPRRSVLAPRLPIDGSVRDDVVVLRDGTFLRGHVAILHPGQQFTIVLLDGESRIVNWSDVVRAVGPSFVEGSNGS